MIGIKDDDTDDQERELRMDQLRADIKLKNAQAATEWPKAFTAIIIAVATVVGVTAGMFGYALHH